MSYHLSRVESEASSLQIMHGSNNSMILLNEQVIEIDEITRKRWERDIYSRFQEARERFPEFFPCFELKNYPVNGLYYSIHFKPLTQYAKRLTRHTADFPHTEQFKPIEMLWNEYGKSELDILFESFPTQRALKPAKLGWANPLGKFF
ncbi:MAG: hypothetical protein RIM23_24555 [Coleofasciculus sp. G3-WIS-01]|uniref:hypothetical protein n=1 Tax=Coleofasciculus sp. G3-WIS-01 TaxID=3069528 RepID=UPI0032F4B71F